MNISEIERVGRVMAYIEATTKLLNTAVKEAQYLTHGKDKQVLRAHMDEAFAWLRYSAGQAASIHSTLEKGDE